MNIYERFQNYTELNNDAVVSRVVRDFMMRYARNRAKFFTFLDWINSKKEVVHAKTIEHAIFTEQTDTADFDTIDIFGVTTNAGGDITDYGNNVGVIDNTLIDLDTANPFFAGDLIRIVGTGDLSDGMFALLRIVAIDPVTGNTVVDIIDHNLPANDTTVFDNSNPDWSCELHTCGTAAPVDGQAPDGVFVTPSFVLNRLMRTRNSVEVGIYTLSDKFHSNIELIRQVFMRWFKVYQDVENSLLFSTTPWVESTLETFAVRGAAANREESMGFGGIPYYIRPHLAGGMVDINGAQLAGIRGECFSIDMSAAAVADDVYNWLDIALRATTVFGNSDMKILLASPAVISLVHTLFRELVVPTTVDYRFIGAPGLWDSHAINMPSGQLVLMPTEGMTGKRLPILGANFTALDNPARPVNDMSAPDFAYILDPTVMNMPVLSVNGVPQELTAKPADISQNNNSFRKVEIDGFYGFTITEPRACGVIIFENI